MLQEHQQRFANNPYTPHEGNIPFTFPVVNPNANPTFAGIDLFAAAAAAANARRHSLPEMLLMSQKEGGNVNGEQ
jgi:hypothetical protein